jgi:hypothetical protein
MYVYEACQKMGVVRIALAVFFNLCASRPYMPKNIVTYNIAYKSTTYAKRNVTKPQKA